MSAKITNRKGQMPAQRPANTKLVPNRTIMQPTKRLRVKSNLTQPIFFKISSNFFLI
jgi:hypothetical protein